MKYVRELNEKDRKAQLDLICEGFPWNTPEAMKARFDLLVAHSNSFGSFEDETLVSQIIATPYTIDFFGTPYTMAGIGFVATSENFQHQHRIDDLMSAIFKKLHEKGCVLSYLAPFSYRFYRRFGYEKVFDMLDFQIVQRDLPRFDHTYRIEEADWAQAAPIVHDLYARRANRARGLMAREPWWEEYKFHLRKPYRFWIAYEDDEPVGYMAYLEDLEKRTLSIFEIVGQEPVLRAFLAQLREQEGVDTIAYSCCQGLDEIVDILEDASPETTIRFQRGMMARVVDVEAFLRSYPFARKAKFAIEIRSDRYAPWNVGIYEVEHRKGHTKVKKVFRTEEPTARMDIEVFVKLFFGVFDLDRDRGRVEADAKLWPMIARCVRPQGVLFADYF